MADWLRFLDTPLFGVSLTIGMLSLFTWLFKNAKSPLLNPLLFSIASIIGLLLALGIPYDTYAKGGAMLSFFIGPAIVALAVPLYKQVDRLKANALPILLGITVGVAVSLSLGVLLSRLLGFSRELMVSLMPLGSTSAISLDLSRMQGGDPALTIFFVNIAGVSGYMMSVKLLHWAGVTGRAACGIALGTASHAMGVKRGLEMGEEEGAMASLALSITSVVTTLLMPLFIRVLGL